MSLTMIKSLPGFLPAFASLAILLTLNPRHVNPGQVTQNASEQQESYRPVVGKPHPDFTLPRIDNRKPLSLSDYRGKKVLLLHFASW